MKEAAAQHPVAQMSAEERIALSEGRWQQSEQEIKNEIVRQAVEGRVVREVIRFPDGTEQVKVTKTEGIDPALLRALSTHHDRWARQLNNQISPDAGVSQVNVAVLQDFMGQGAGEKQLTATEWNSGQQDPVVDV